MLLDLVNKVIPNSECLVRAVGDGAAGAAVAAPFFAVSASAHARIISLAIALKYVLSKDSYRKLLCPSVVATSNREAAKHYSCV